MEQVRGGNISLKSKLQLTALIAARRLCRDAANKLSKDEQSGCCCCRVLLQCKGSKTKMLSAKNCQSLQSIPKQQQVTCKLSINPAVLQLNCILRGCFISVLWYTALYLALLISTSSKMLPPTSHNVDPTLHHSVKHRMQAML